MWVIDSRTSPYKLAQSLFKNHGWEPDLAFAAARAYLGRPKDAPSYAQVMARMQSVVYCPIVTEFEQQQIMVAYMRHKRGKHMETPWKV